MDVKVPKIYLPVFTSRHRYIVLGGGRGSGKSHVIATHLILAAAQKKHRILCTREIQNSIKDSVYRLLCDTIEKLSLTDFFKIKQDRIDAPHGGEILFKGLRHNVSDIKSMEGITLCWDEEAQTTSQASLDLLIPTIRQEGSQIIFTYNPTTPEDPVHTNYAIANRDDVLSIVANYDSNPFFPDVLKAEMEYDKRTNLEKYNHIWLGKPVIHTDAQIFSDKYIVEDFETPAGVDFYYGADWGFAQDATALIRAFVLEEDLYIDYEAYGVLVDLDSTPAMFETVPDSKRWPIIADSARPETIDFLQRRGFTISGARKGAGSVVDGITRLRGFQRIYIHPRCKHTADEFRLYSYKVDRLTGKILPIPEDKHNHCIDALRYAIEDIKEYAIIRRYGQ